MGHTPYLQVVTFPGDIVRLGKVMMKLSQWGPLIEKFVVIVLRAQGIMGAQMGLNRCGKLSGW